MEKKYILTDETRDVNGHILHRIKAVRDFNNVKAGDLGGWIEKEKNLSHEGSCWIYDEGCVYENAFISDQAFIHSHALVFGNAVISGSACIGDNAIALENAKISEKAYIGGNANIRGQSIIKGTSIIRGETVIDKDAIISSFALLDGKAIIKNHGAIKYKTDALIVGPIGRWLNYTTFYRTGDNDIWVSCGCFTGSITDFTKCVKETHAEGSRHRINYLNAINLAKSYFKQH